MCLAQMLIQEKQTLGWHQFQGDLQLNLISTLSTAVRSSLRVTEYITDHNYVPSLLLVRKFSHLKNDT